MKKNHRTWKRVASACLCGVMLASVATTGLSYAATKNQALDNVLQDAGLIQTTEAATLNYNTELAKFPKSYQTKLATLHKQYPNWTFVAEYLDRDWQDVLAGENRSKVSTVTGASTLLRSKQSGDYNPSTGSYTVRDASSSGTYSANELAVAYYLDPRNLLDPKNIFQFEALSYNAAFQNRVGVEAILDGSWMDRQNITYYNKSGSKKVIDDTYADVLMNAGKAADVSPYFLAAKILNEVGKTSPSSSASGKNSSYPGIYNTYCIGAYNSSSPIEKGLKYAAGSGDYQRPWNTPVKAVAGGAEWIAEGYINNSAGAQDTLYYQRFDVVKEDKNPYSHQYATNISYATVQSRTTYFGYEKNKMLSKKMVFYIPVYDNMPGEKAQSKTVKLSTTPATQTGTVNGSDVNVRDEAKQSGNQVARLAEGTKVTILGKMRSSSDYYSYYNEEPFWYKIKAGSQTGYISSRFVTLSNTITLKPGATYQLGATLSSKNTGEVNLMSTREAVATVAADGKITAKASGTCDIIAYTSAGGYDVVTLKVSSSATNSKSTAKAIPKTDQAGFGTSSSGSGSTSSASGGSCTISGSGVNIRKGAGTNFAAVGTYDKGDKVTVTAVSDNWCKTKEGWVSGDYVVPSKTGTVSGTNSLTVRNAAGTSGAAVGTVKSGVSLKLYNSQKVGTTTWYLTNRGGWVSGKYVKLAGASSGGSTASSAVTYLSAKITGSDVNIRSGASTAYSVVGSYAKNASIKVIAVAGSWAKTDKGWVSGDYVSATRGTASGADQIVVRKAPSSSGAELKKVKKNTSLKLYAKKTVDKVVWYLTSAGGWVSSKNLKISGTSSSTTASSTSVSVKVSGSNVNIRKGPSTSYAVVGSYNKGDKITVTAADDGWIKTSKGWINANYVTAGNGKVSGTSTLNVRTTPSISAKIVAAVKSGTSLKLYASKKVDSTTWYLTNKDGWVSSKYVKR